MTVKWNPQTEQRFTELRLRQLSGNLTLEEKEELEKLRAFVSKIESETIAPNLQQLESKQVAIQRVLENEKSENEDLVQLFNQQALLIADTKRWLKEFEQRYSSIQNSFSHLAT